MKGKQWLLEKINEVRKYYEEVYKSGSEDTIDQFYLAGKLEGLDEVTDLVNQIEELAEPQKTVVPQFIADYIDWYNEQDITTRNQEVMVQEFIRPVMLEYPKKDKVIEYGSKHAFKMLRALFNGYEVEKEPKYVVKFPDSKFGTPAYGTIATLIDRKEMYVSYASPGVNLKPNEYTEEEIKEVGERYWALAERVED